MFAIPDHQHFLHIRDLIVRKCRLYHIFFVDFASIHGTSLNIIKILCQFKMLKYLFCVNLRLGGRQDHFFALFSAFFQQMRDSRINFIFENTFHGIIFTVKTHAFLCFFFIKPVKFFKRIYKRRTHETVKIALFFGNPQISKCIGNGIRDPVCGVRDRSVQVKQQIFYHFLFSLPTPAEQLLLSEASLRIQTLSPIRR